MSTNVIDANTTDGKVNVLLIRFFQEPGEKTTTVKKEWDALSEDDRAELRAIVRANPEQIGCVAA